MSRPVASCGSHETLEKHCLCCSECLVGHNCPQTVGTEVVRVAHVLSPRVAHIFYIYFGVFFTIGDRTCAPLPELLSLAGRPKPPFLNDAMAGSCHRSSGSPTWGMPTPEEVISVIYFGRYRRLQIHGGHLPARGAAGAVDHPWIRSRCTRPQNRMEISSSGGGMAQF